MKILQSKSGAKPTLCYVTDRRSLRVAAGGDAGSALVEQIRKAVGAGADWIQIREKDLEARELLRLTRAAMAVCSEAGSAARVVVNDRLDVALAARAGGAHLGENSLPVRIAAEARRATAAGDFLLGVSCHSLEGAVDAARGGADYIFLGPIFATPSKAAYGEPLGLERLREVCGAVAIPVIAIGGITARNAAACREAGAAGFAGIRLFQEAGEAGGSAADIRRNIV